MPETTQAVSAPPTQAPPPAPPQKRPYTLRFEPVGEFNETELFTKGTLRAKLWISDKIVASFKSLTGEEVDRINEAVKVTPQTTTAQYNTEITYHNLAHSIESVNGSVMPSDFAERLKKFRSMASAVIGRLSLAYLEFNDRIDELFVGKGVAELTKKS